MAPEQRYKQALIEIAALFTGKKTGLGEDESAHDYVGGHVDDAYDMGFNHGLEGGYEDAAKIAKAALAEA